MTTRTKLHEEIGALIAARRPFDDTATAVLDAVLPQIRSAVLDAILSMPHGYRPSDVAEELGHQDFADWTAYERSEAAR